MRIRNSESLRSNTKRKEPGSPLIRRNLPSVRGWSFEIERIFSASRGSASCSAYALIRHTLSFNIRAHSLAALKAMRLKKPYTPGVHRLGRSDYIGWHYARVAPVPRRFTKLLGRRMKCRPSTFAGREARMRARLRRSFTTSYSRPALTGDRFFRTSYAFDSRTVPDTVECRDIGQTSILLAT